MKAFKSACLLLAVMAATVVDAGPIGSVPIVPADPDAAGQELAAKLRSMRPAENYTNSATLRVFFRRKLLREEPLEIVVCAGTTNWNTIYRWNPGTTNQAELCIISGETGHTEYRLRSVEAGVVSELSPSGAGLMVSFANSEFWLADLGMEFLQWPTHRLLKKEICRGQSCDKLESVAPPSQTNGYVRVVSWFDIDTGGPVLVEAYDAAGKMLKEFKPNDFKKVDGQWQVEEVEISNIRSRVRSTIHFDLGSN